MTGEPEVARTPQDPGPAAGALPATALQAGMLYHAAANPGTGVDIEQISVRFDEPLDVERFRAAWQAVFTRHPILSARFSWGSSPQPTLHLDRIEEVVVRVDDWCDLAEVDQERRIPEAKRSDRVIDFDLAAGPLHRFTLARLADERWWFLWSFHHTVLDGRSFPIVLREVFLLYEHGPDHPLPATPGFDRYLRALSDQELEPARTYWTEKLAGVEASSVIPSTPTPAGQPERSGPSVVPIEVELGRNRSDRLRAAADQLGASLNTFVQAAWYLLLVHHTQQPTITFGTTRACRHVVEGSADMVGLLINTIPMVVPVDREETVGSLLARLRAEQIELRDYETTPLPLIASCLPRGTGELVDSIVVFDEASLDARMAAALDGHGPRRRFTYDGQTNAPLTLLAYGDPSMLIRLEYATDRYDDATGRRLLEQFVALLDGLAGGHEQPAVTLPYLTEEEHRRYDSWNATDVDYQLETTLPALFERQVAATPDAPALVVGEQTLTYREFNRRANRLAHHLRRRGVGRDTPVGIFAERSFDMMIAIYAVLKAGGAYVPLDPEHPAERLQFMVEDSGITSVLGPSHLLPRLPEADVDRLVLDRADPPWADLPDTDPDPASGPDDLAYILYTSGSTGRPKGVLIEHRAIVNRLLWMQEAFPLTADDCVLQKTPFSFDVSVWELFWPLQVGTRLVLADPAGHRDTFYMAELIERQRVTTLHFVPSMLQLFVEEPTAGRCRSIRRVICSGEALPRSLQDRLFEVLPDTELHNLYGPTEAAVDVTWWRCDPDSPLATVPIGHPIANTRIHVLDPDLQRLPLGVPGELHIGGVQLARGYHRRPELTEQRFVPDPWSDHPGDRLYKTGDLVRHLPDGAVDFLGRLDFQVKIRGQRVELGEIEAVIAEHPMVREVLVVASGSTAADTQLVAYAVADLDALGGETSAEPAIKAHCEASLPSSMVPTVWVFLSALPLNANGKVDRGALPRPVLGTAGRQLEAAQSTTESEVLSIWQSLLGDQPVGVTETFFDVGGNSLLLVQLSQLLSDRFERTITVRQLLRSSTVRQQAELVTGALDGHDEVVSTASAAAEARRSRRGHRRGTRAKT